MIVLVLQCLPIAIGFLALVPAIALLRSALRHFRERAIWSAAHRLAPLVRDRRRAARSYVAPYIAYQPLCSDSARRRLDRLYATMRGHL